jgi:hypothetical protein
LLGAVDPQAAVELAVTHLELLSGEHAHERTHAG